jgi:hypothetical protein
MNFKHGFGESHVNYEGTSIKYENNYEAKGAGSNAGIDDRQHDDPGACEIVFPD